MTYDQSNDRDCTALAPEDLDAITTLNQLVPAVEETAEGLAQLQSALANWPLEVDACEIALGLIGDHHEREFRLPSPWPGNDQNPVIGAMWQANSEGVTPPRSAVIALHPGFSGDLVAMRVLTRFLRDRGSDVFAPWAPWHGPRNTTIWPSGGPLVGTGAAGMILAVMQGEVETLALVKSLRAVGYERIYLTGASLGGLVGALATSRTPLDGAALLIPATDFQHQLWPAANKSDIARTSEVFSLIQKGFDAIHAGRRRLHPRTQPQRVHVLAGAQDAVCRMDTVREFCEAWGIAPPVELPCGHLAFFQRWAEARSYVTRWFSAGA